jgi:hypothetical protein
MNPGVKDNARNDDKIRFRIRRVGKFKHSYIDSI